jgi:hypothetical protein
MLSKIKKLLQFRVKRWHGAMGGWKEKDIRVIAVLQEDVWYWALAEYLADGWLTRICEWMCHVPLPKVVREMEGHWDKDDPEYFAKYEDWAGSDFGSLWHCHVESPVCQFVWKRRNWQGDICVEMTLDEARKKFGEEHETIKWVEKELAQHKEWDAEELAEIRKAYAAGELTREQAFEKLGWQFEGENLDTLLDGQSCEKRE